MTRVMEGTLKFICHFLFMKIFFVISFFISHNSRSIFGHTTVAYDFNDRKDYVKLVEYERASFHANHTIIFAIKQQNIDEIKKILSDISDPASMYYQSYLPANQVHKFVSNPPCVDKLLSFLHLNSVDIVKRTLYDEYIFASAPIFVWERILSTNLGLYAHFEDIHPPIWRATSYTLDDDIAVCVSTIFKLIHLPLPQSVSSIKFSKVTSDNFLSAVTYITPSSLNSYYNISSNSGSSNITQTVYSAEGQYYSSEDLSTFQSHFGLPRTVVNADPNHRDSDIKCQTRVTNCQESNLDVQYITSIAQNMNTTVIYDSSNDAFVSWITSVADTSSPSSVYSISYGIVESYLSGYSSYVTHFNIEALKLGLMGTTIVVATGDDGAPGYRARSDISKCSYDPSFPATSPYVLAVGATMGAEVGQVEVACDANLEGIITSGGGFSNIIPAPAYQKRAVNDYLFSVTSLPYVGYNATGRAIPDISLAGKHYLTVIGGSFYKVSGTSASAPVVAAMIALVNSARLKNGKPTLGWINPALYAVNGSFTNDIINGNNMCTTGLCCPHGFYTAIGWDPITGFGSIDYSKFYQLFSGSGKDVRFHSPAIVGRFSKLPSLAPTVAPSGTPSAVKEIKREGSNNLTLIYGVSVAGGLLLVFIGAIYYYYYYIYRKQPLDTMKFYPKHYYMGNTHLRLKIYPAASSNLTRGISAQTSRGLSIQSSRP